MTNDIIIIRICEPHLRYFRISHLLDRNEEILRILVEMSSRFVPVAPLPLTFKMYGIMADLWNLQEITNFLLNFRKLQGHREIFLKINFRCTASVDSCPKYPSNLGDSWQKLHSKIDILKISFDKKLYIGKNS